MDKKKLVLQILIFIPGVLFLIFGTVGLLVIISEYYQPTSFYGSLYVSSPYFVLEVFLFPLIVGVLSVLTTIGLHKSLRYARWTGISGSVFYFIFDGLWFLVSPLSLFSLFFWVLITLPIVQLVLLVFQWDNLALGNKVAMKTKKRIGSVVAILVIISIVLVVSPKVYKQYILAPFDYQNYDIGYGCNSPDGWIYLDSIGRFIGGPLFWYSPPESDAQSDNITFTIMYHKTYFYPEEPIIYLLEGEVLNLISQGEKYYNESNFTAIQHYQHDVNNMIGYAYEFTIDHYYYNITMKIMEILVEKNHRIFLIRYEAPLTHYDTYLSVVEKSIETLTIV